MTRTYFAATLIRNGKVQEVDVQGGAVSEHHECDYRKALVLIGAVSLKYPLAFLAFLILGLIYAVYHIIKDRKKNDEAGSAGDGSPS